MKTMQQLADGVTDYLLNDALPAMPNGLSKFLAYAAVGAMKGRDPIALVAPYMQMLQAVGLTDSTGQVDEVALKAAMDTAFTNQPTVSLMGFTFDSTDKDKLYRRLEI